MNKHLFPSYCLANYLVNFVDSGEGRGGGGGGESYT